MPGDFDGSKLRHGLYRVWWRSGGCSLASVGSTSGGARWLAPCNWISPPSTDWSKVLKVDLLVADDSDKARAAKPFAWLEHVEAARDLLKTILEVEHGE